MRTDICKMLGIKYPIFQGAMTFVSDQYLVAAVSNAVMLELTMGNYREVLKTIEIPALVVYGMPGSLY